MKSIITATLAIFLIIGCILVISLRIYNYMNLNEDTENSIEQTLGEPFRHKEHTHEHSGLACCPCGVCHMKLPNKENEESEHKHEPIEFPLMFQLISVITILSVLLAALHI